MMKAAGYWKPLSDYYMGEQEKQFYNAIVILAVLIGVLFVYFIITIVRYHRRYIRLQKQRIFAEITIQENERKRISNDLHDSLGPLLSAVKLNINSVDIHDTEDKKVIEKTGKYLDEIIMSMRQISYNLLPSTLERKGLIAAVKEFINQMSQSGVRIQLFIIKEGKIPKEKEIHVFRIIQEIVHNTLKHAEAKQLQMAISSENGFLQLLTKDDGKGFDVNKTKSESSGLGLKSLESRVEILRGVLALDSKHGEGTNYFIKIPLA